MSNWTSTPPNEDGFYWIRAHGGGPAIGYWHNRYRGLSLIGTPSVLWESRDFLGDRLPDTEQVLCENGIEFLPERIKEPTL